MKRILLSTALALVLSGTLALAQSTESPATTTPTGGKHFHQHHHNPQREAAMLSKKLNLSSDQTAKLEPILADRDQKMTAIWSNTSLTPDEKKQQMRAIHQSTKQQLSTVLTPDQLEQLKALRHHRGGPNQPQATPQATPAPGL